jgi:peptidyl-prolyl cis-trans isomerase A (cyclophilin A)
MSPLMACRPGLMRHADLWYDTVAPGGKRLCHSAGGRSPICAIRDCLFGSVGGGKRGAGPDMRNSKNSATMLLGAILAISLCLCAGCSDSPQALDCECPYRPLQPLVQMNTTMGSIILELDMSRAPVSVGNFLEYAATSFYDSTIIHRVLPGFVIQGGQYTRDLERKEAHDPIICESYNGLSNLRGTIAVARSSSSNSGACQFFINVQDNPSLDRQDDSRPGYAVFGRVIAGMDVADSIASVPTSTQQMPDGTPMQNVPVAPVIVLSVRRIK